MKSIMISGLLLVLSLPAFSQAPGSDTDGPGNSLTESTNCFEGLNSQRKVCSLKVMQLNNSGAHLITANNTSCKDDSGFPVANVANDEIISDSGNQTSYRSVSGSEYTRSDLTISSSKNLPTSFTASYWPSTFAGRTFKSPSIKVVCSGLKLKKTK